MSKYIKGNSVANATSYELHSKVAGGSTLLANKSEINFNLDELNLSAGTYTLSVKAKADGYEDSDYSNEVTYTVEDVDTGDVTYLTNTYIKSNGVAATANGYTSTDFVEVTVGESWSYIGTTASSSAICVASYDSSQVFIKALIGAEDHSTGTTFIIPENSTPIAYIRACGKTNTGVNLILSKISG